MFAAWVKIEVQIDGGRRRQTVCFPQKAVSCPFIFILIQASKICGLFTEALTSFSYE